jgi:hypothetical protein
MANSLSLLLNISTIFMTNERLTKIQHFDAHIKTLSHERKLIVQISSKLPSNLSPSLLSIKSTGLRLLEMHISPFQRNLNHASDVWIIKGNRRAHTAFCHWHFAPWSQ